MYRVVLADDEIIIRENMSRRIHWEKYGFQLVCSCKNGQEVLDYLKEHTADLVISDICMPHLDGIGLCERLSREYPEVKVMILSGYDEFEYAQKSIQYGVLEYVLKPVTSAEMGKYLEKVAALLDRERREKKDRGRYQEIYRENYIRISSGRLMDFITGEVDREQCARDLEEMDISLPVSGYRAAVVESGLFSDQNRESSLIAFVVFNIAEQTVNESYAGCTCLGPNNRTVILFEDDGDSETEVRIGDICREIIGRVKTHTGMQPVIGLGSHVAKADSIGRSYEEAKEAVGFEYLFGRGQIIRMADRTGLQVRQQVAEVLDRLQDCVRKMDANGLPAVVLSLKEVMRAGWYVPAQCRVALCSGLERLRQLQKSCRVWQGDEAYDCAEERIIAAADLEEAAAALETYAGNCVEVMERQYQGSSGRYVQKALDFIEKNYTNPELGIREVCGYLNLSPSHFSSIIKAETGETFVEVLNRLRMKHAKELLEHTGLKTGEVAKQAGFGDPHYFGIVFKKTTGMTPTAYARKYNRKGQE